jgi:hypothetical protein
MPKMTKRQRSRPLRRDGFRWNGFFSSGNPDGIQSGSVYINGTQITESEGHPWSKNDRYKGEDVGGDFYTISHRYGDARARIHDPQPQYTFDDGERYAYYGPLYPLRTSADVGSTDNRKDIRMKFSENFWPPDLSHSDEVLDAYGTSAISLCKPTSSPANLTVALGELFREGIPSMVGHQAWETRAKDFRASGSEFLNVQFGWLPFIADIKSTASAIIDAEDLMTQYERDSGRLVRRRYEFPSSRETTVTDMSNLSQYNPNQDVYAGNRVLIAKFNHDNQAERKLIREREIVRKIWFSGGFTYHLPRDYYSRGKVGKAAFFASHFLGLELTPESVWNLAPWSWAVDWFTNIGDTLSNISDFATDGLVLRYGYLMEHTIIKDTYTLGELQLEGYPRNSISSTFITEVKKRRRATPFGFGFDMAGLTDRQAAIIAALGISRVPR